MGNKVSNLSPEKLHKKLLDDTQGTRYIMDKLLKYLLKEIGEQDLLKISDPRECEKYVMFTANTLNKYFYELQIMPYKDKKGVIAFRPVRELTTKLDEESKKTKEGLCLIVAYFYIRIFQIYGALALTLIDDINTSTRSGMTDMGRSLLPRGYGEAYFGGGELSKEQTERLGKYKFLKSFLTDDSSIYSGYRTKYKEEDIYFKTDGDDGIFTIQFNSKNKATIVIKAENYSDYIELTFDTLTYTKDSEKHKRDFPGIVERKIKVKIDPFSGSYYINKSRKIEIKDYFNLLLKKTIEYIKLEKDAYDRYDGSDRYDRYDRYDGSDRYDRYDRYDRSDSKRYTDPKITELQLSKTITSLNTVKPYGHCVSRALQLLQTSPFKGTPYISHICNATFLESDRNKSGIPKSGIPMRDDKLSTSPGLSSLAKLFYDTVKQGSNIIEISKFDQYINFMSQMAFLFGDNLKSDKSPRDMNEYTNGLSTISNKKDRIFCKGTTTDIKINEEIKNDVYDYVKLLFQTQHTHAIECGKIFKLLFDIQKKESGNFKISLSTNIIKYGFPEIQRINEISRNLLVKYYTRCETIYVNGFRKILSKT